MTEIDSLVKKFLENTITPTESLRLNELLLKNINEMLRMAREHSKFMERMEKAI